MTSPDPTLGSGASQGPMALALLEARAAGARGEVPVGAVIVAGPTVIAQAGNRTRELSDPTAHAEMLAIQQAAEKLGADRLTGADLYVTLEPCTMCAGAISHARLRRLYFAALDEKGGGVVSGVRFFSAASCHHAPEVYSGIGEQAASDLLRSFFRERRA